MYVGRERCGFDTILLLWYRIYTPLVLIYKKKKKKSKKINNRKHAFGYFCQHLSKPLRSFQATEIGTVLHKLVQNSWCQMLRENMPVTLQENSGEAHSLVKGSFLNAFAVEIPCNSMALGPDPLPGMTPCLVPYVYDHASMLTSVHSNSI